MSISRREFVAGTATVGAIGIGLSSQSMAEVMNFPDPVRPTFIATWAFGKPACEVAVNAIKSGKTGLDAIEAGIQLVEADVSNSSVGIGGIPNAEGEVELDACIMSGPGHRCGSVAGLQKILHPISVARRVMEQTPHVMLVGEGARKFATSQGFPIINLLTDQQRENFEAWKKEQKPKKAGGDNHDTIAMVGVDAKGDMFGGCSTSGLAFKLPGRVGDSPIIGSGLYVDNQVGAAGATGVGENVMRFCGSFMVVEMMRQGMEPEDACRGAIQRISEISGLPLDKLDINFIALNKAGRYGAAGTSSGFKLGVAMEGKAEVVDAFSMTQKPIGPEGGNRKK